MELSGCERWVLSCRLRELKERLFVGVEVW
jgi:hypothetical protein